MLRKFFLFFFFHLFLMFAHAQTDGYLNAMSTASSSGNSGSLNISYSVGETIGFDNSCAYTTGIIQPQCVCIVAIDEMFDKQFKSHFYPNPTNNHIIVESNFLDFSKYEISTIDGRLLYWGIFDYNPIDIENLPVGTYLLKLSASDNTNSKTVKIIKQ